MDALGRQIRRGRQRLLRLLRPARRHAQGLRHGCLAIRSRGRAAKPSRRARSRRGRLAGRRQAGQAQGLRGAQSAGQGERCLRAHAAGALQAKTRRLQISTLARIPHRIAENRDWKNPAFQAEGGGGWEVTIVIVREGGRPSSRKLRRYVLGVMPRLLDHPPSRMMTVVNDDKRQSSGSTLTIEAPWLLPIHSVPGFLASSTKTRRMLVGRGSGYSVYCPVLTSRRATRSVFIEAVQALPFLSATAS